jgi:hypothetical protein
MVRPNQTFSLNGLTWRVVHVNASRAHCVATTVREVTVVDANGHTRSFLAKDGRSLDISPDTPIDDLRSFSL